MGLNKTVHVLCLINDPPFPLAPEPLPPFVRGLMMLAEVCPFFFKNTFYQLFHHYKRFCLFLLPPAWMKSEQQVPNLCPPPPLLPLQCFQKSQQNILKAKSGRVAPHPTDCFKLFLTLLVSDQMSAAQRGLPETLNQFEIKCY